MGVIQYPTPIPVTNGNFPQFKFAIFSDNLTVVSTPGYLNQSSIQSGVPLSNADIIMALYSFNQQTQTGTFAILTVSIAASNGQITLAAWSTGGGGAPVVLPTIANYIAHFTNTSGTISSAAANVINAGNIQAGLSGTAGTLTSYPATANTGSLSLAAVSNTGNTATVISNAVMGQATTLSIPDPGVASATIPVITGSLVNGNLVKANGTTGLIEDAGTTLSNIMFDNIVNTMTAPGRIILPKANGTEAAGAVTANGTAGFITTSTLAIAGDTSYVITWTNSYITATSVITLFLQGGTNGVPSYTLSAVPGAGTATVAINNIGTNAISGTMILGYTVW